MKYIIMADGKGSRWNNYNNIIKPLIEINGETIIGRTVRLLNELDPNSEVIITSRNEKLDIEGSTRYVPKNNNEEIDRFTYELITDNICFLYGDTYYTEEAMLEIIQNKNDSLLFFGNDKKIFAIKVYNSNVFKNIINKIKEANKNDFSPGIMVFREFAKITGESNLNNIFVNVEDKTADFNYPKDYLNYIKKD